MRTVVVRLRPGQDLRPELLAVAERERIQAGLVLTGVGSLSRARLRLAGAAVGREPDPETGYDELVVRRVGEPAR
jgi:predicted DNA-binding protein with PD1-like motif